MIVKMKVDANFAYHNVGEGLFYIGEIKLDNSNEFSFVYDCGSTTKRNICESIDKFKKASNGDSIDLLILSHLHEDHTRGIDMLFSNFKVKEVVLPYFSPEERLLIASRKIDMDDWYYRFLSDPVKFFIEEKNVERVIIIFGGNEGEEENPPDNDLPKPDGDSDKINFDGMPNDDSDEVNAISQNEKWKGYMESGKLLIKKYNRYATVFGFWIFKFFNYKISQQTKCQVTDCLKKNLSLSGNTTEEIKEIIKSKEGRIKAKACYNIIKGELNNTSLILYHGPIAGEIEVYIQSSCRYQFLNRRCCPCNYHYGCCEGEFMPYGFNGDKIGQLLTGDIDLHIKYDEIKQYYRHYLSNVFMGQVPHHGSKNNWKNELLDDTSNSKIWVISAGIDNRYRHPSLKVMDDICFRGMRPVWVNENRGLIIRCIGII